MSSGALTPFGNAVAGAGGAIVALTSVYPLDVVKTRLQVQSKAAKASGATDVYASTLQALQSIVASEGVAGLYAGLPAGLLGVASTNFAYFYFYSALRTAYAKRIGVGQAISTAMELLVGAGAGALAQIFTIPVSVVVTRQQTTTPSERLGFIQTWNQIVNEDGVTGLWKGLKPSLVLVVNPAITYGFFERMRSALVARGSDPGGKPAVLSALQTFLLGVLSKSIATVVTYPYIMAKVRLQWKAPKSLRDSGKIKPYKGAIDVLRRTLREEGLRGWFKGIRPQLLKAVLSQAILFVSKDKLAEYTVLLFALVYRVQASVTSAPTTA